MLLKQNSKIFRQGELEQSELKHVKKPLDEASKGKGNENEEQKHFKSSMQT